MWTGMNRTSVRNPENIVLALKILDQGFASKDTVSRNKTLITILVKESNWTLRTFFQILTHSTVARRDITAFLYPSRHPEKAESEEAP